MGSANKFAYPYLYILLSCWNEKESNLVHCLPWKSTFLVKYANNIEKALDGKGSYYCIMSVVEICQCECMNLCILST